MRFIFNLVRFLFVQENSQCRGRHGVFFDEGGINNNEYKGESWLPFLEWGTVIVVIVGLIVGICFLVRIAGLAVRSFRPTASPAFVLFFIF